MKIKLFGLNNRDEFNEFEGRVRQIRGFAYVILFSTKDLHQKREKHGPNATNKVLKHLGG
jgi:hypothetical protein